MEPGDNNRISIAARLSEAHQNVRLVPEQVAAVRHPWLTGVLGTLAGIVLGAGLAPVLSKPYPPEAIQAVSIGCASSIDKCDSLGFRDDVNLVMIAIGIIILFVYCALHFAGISKVNKAKPNSNTAEPGGVALRQP